MAHIEIMKILNLGTNTFYRLFEVAGKPDLTLREDK